METTGGSTGESARLPCLDGLWRLLCFDDDDDEEEDDEEPVDLV